MRPPWRLAPALLLLLGCNGAPPRPRPPLDGGLEPPSPDEEQREARPGREEDDGSSRLARAAAAKVLPSLLPIDAREVQWYAVWRGDRAAEAALFAAEGAEGRPFLDSAGLSAPGAADGDVGLRLWPTGDELWVFPAGALGPEVGTVPYRAWAPETTWTDGADGRGRRGAPEVVETRAGQWRCVRTDHTRGDLTIRHFFAPERGLVRLEVLVRQAPRVRLDLVEVVPRGAPAEGYDASTPQALWRSVRAAIRRADMDGFEGLVAPALRRPAPRRSLSSRVGPEDGDPRADRVRARLDEVIALELLVRSTWTVTGDEAVAQGVIAGDRQKGELVRVRVLLARGADGAWRWNGVEPAR